VKIFGIGLARTGTSSLAEALQTIGFTAKHFPRDYSDIERYDCLTDTSVTLGYRYLDFMFPSAKFILTTRAVEPWLDSMRALLGYLATQGVAERYHRLHLALYGTAVYDEDLLRTARSRHEREVRAHFARRPTQLLTLDIDEPDPYALLCPFLSAPPPGTPFPHSNDRSAMYRSRPDFHS
jgi:Sulfotransferase domain